MSWNIMSLNLTRVGQEYLRGGGIWKKPKDRTFSIFERLNCFYENYTVFSRYCWQLQVFYGYGQQQKGSSRQFKNRAEHYFLERLPQSCKTDGVIRATFKGECSQFNLKRLQHSQWICTMRFGSVPSRDHNPLLSVREQGR